MTEPSAGTDRGGSAVRTPEEATTDNERIDEAGRESFPASDPPSWTLGVEPPSIAPAPAQGTATPH